MDIKFHLKWRYGKNIPSVVIQYEIQRLCYECFKYPVACFMKILAEVLNIEDSSVLDLTFGVGEFYRFWKPSYLVAFDIVDWRKHGYEFVVTPNEFYEMDFSKCEEVLKDRKFDVVIFDPPYPVHPVKTSWRKIKTYLYHGSENFVSMLQSFPKIAKKYSTKYIIMKFMDNKKATIFDVVNIFGQKPKYLIIYRLIPPAIPTRPVTYIKVHSYYIIWKKQPNKTNKPTQQTKYI